MGINYRSKVLAGVACFLFAAGAIFAYARPRGGRSQRPPEDKRLDLVVQFNANVPLENAVAYERELGISTIVPFLQEHGYEIGSVFSMTQILLENGTPYRALLNAMAKEPEKDSSRIVFVTVSAEPAQWPGKLISSVVVLDNFLSDIRRARTLQLPAELRILWTYEDAPARLSVDETIAVMPQRVREALGSYDLQYQEKVKSGNYPDVVPFYRPAR